MYHTQGKVCLEWSSNLAYAIGLIVTDGCLSPDGRHILFVSKDREMIENFQTSLGIHEKVAPISVLTAILAQAKMM